MMLGWAFAPFLPDLHTNKKPKVGGAAEHFELCVNLDLERASRVTMALIIRPCACIFG
jgi:hypothetical protein